MEITCRGEKNTVMIEDRKDIKSYPDRGQKRIQIQKKSKYGLMNIGKKTRMTQKPSRMTTNQKKGEDR